MSASKQGDELELTFEQQQDISTILEGFRSNPSNSNKFRYELFAYINEVLTAEVGELLRKERTKLLNELLSEMPEKVAIDTTPNTWSLERGKYTTQDELYRRSFLNGNNKAIDTMTDLIKRKLDV